MKQLEINEVIKEYNDGEKSVDVEKCNSFSEIEIELLKAPFPFDEVTWKPQIVSKDKKTAMGAAYVSKWPYIKRLNMIFGSDWSASYSMNESGTVSECTVTIRGRPQTEVGEEWGNNNSNRATTAAAQAFKRACAAHGLGLYFYDLGMQWGAFNGKSFTELAEKQLKVSIITEESTYWNYIWIENLDPWKAANLAIKVKNGKFSWKEALDQIRNESI